MGCDIHVSLEIKKNGVWDSANVYYKEDGDFKILPVFEERSYELFSQLCGVRGLFTCPKISEPRDLPVNMSPETKEYLEDPEYHSHSWNTLKELRDFNTKEMGRLIENIEQQVDKLMLWRFTRIENGQDVRIVYAFDN